MRLLRRIGISIAAALATAIGVAIIAALLDLYLTGHGYPSIMREVVTWPPAGIHLSVPDAVLLVAAVAAGVLTWRCSRFGDR